MVAKIDRHIGHRLSGLRLRCGFDAKAFAQLLDMPVGQLSAIERGDQRISSTLLYECAGRLGVPMHYFFSGPYNFTFEEIVDDLLRDRDAVLREIDD